MAKAEKEKGPSKTALVKEALENVGKDAGPNDLINYIKTTHKVELDYALVASYKSSILKKMGGGGSGKRGRRAGGSNVVDLNDLLAVRELLNRIGKDQLEKLIKVVAD
jgi:hypothetical protein